jgi:hypothetical protein
MIILALLVLSQNSNPSFTIIEAHRQESFAGKLGKQVEDTYLVERDGNRVTIHVALGHTRFGHTRAPFTVGEQISLPADAASRGYRLLGDEVR